MLLRQLNNAFDLPFDRKKNLWISYSERCTKGEVP